MLMCLVPLVGVGQYMKVPTHYDAQVTAEHIIKGHLKMYLLDSVKVVTEKKNERYITDCGMDPGRAKAKLDKAFAKGKSTNANKAQKGLTRFSDNQPHNEAAKSEKASHAKPKNKNRKPR